MDAPSLELFFGWSPGKISRVGSTLLTAERLELGDLKFKGKQLSKNNRLSIYLFGH